MSFGWRARIGFISPGTSGVHTSSLEMEMIAPEGVLFINKFLDGPKSLSLEHLVEMLPQVEPAARSIAKNANVDLILMGGAPLVLANGATKLIRMIEDAARIPATTNITGMVNGLRRLDMHKLVVLAPYYGEHLVDMVRDFLEGEGFEIVSMVGGAGVEFGKHKELSQYQTYRAAKRAFLDAPAADGLVIVGGGAPLHEIIDILEVDIGKPVIANNFASLWNALDMANVRQPISGYGTLLTLL